MQQLVVISLWLMIVATDIKFRRIPKSLNFALIALLIPLGAKFSVFAAVIWMAYLIIFKVSGAAIGYGDVRLAPATVHFLVGSPLGWEVILKQHCLAWSVGGVHALLIGRRGAQSLPFAPYLLIAGLLYQASIQISLR